MSKPILSELEYNADDVASAILSNADLAIANDDLGVTDVSDKFVLDSAWSEYVVRNIYKFMNFIFFNVGAEKSSVPSSNDTIWTIDSDIRPNDVYAVTSVTREGDTSNMIKIIDTTGIIQIDSPVEVLSSSDAYFRVIINGWYRMD